MYDDPVSKVMRKRKLVIAKPQASVLQVAKRMAKRNVGAVLVLDDSGLVGILTERDVVFRVVGAGLDPRATRVAEVMTREPVTIGPERPFGQALAIMHREGFRHLPVVDRGAVLGIVSARSALDPDLEEFASEARRREHYHAMR
jgi:CBS domain-containing protein